GFDKDAAEPDRLALGREGGHSRRRIVHAKDRTGHAIERVLLAQARAHPKIVVLENAIAIDLVLESKHLAGRRLAPSRERVWGAYLLDGAPGSTDAAAGAAHVIRE